MVVPAALLATAFELRREREAEWPSRTASAITECRRFAYRTQVESWFESTLAAAEAACGAARAERRHVPIAEPLGASLDVTSDDTGRIIAPIRLDVHVIVGSHEGAHIDPLLRGEPLFRRPPLDRFGSLQVTSQLTTDILPEQPRELAVPASAPLVVTVERTLAPGGRMRVRMTHGGQPASVAASRGEWFLWVPAESASAGRGSTIAMRLGEASRASWRLVGQAFVRAVSCGDLRVPVSRPLAMADGATLVISDGADAATEPTLELHGHRFVISVSHAGQHVAPAAPDDHRVELLVLSAFCLLGVFAYLAGARFARPDRDGRG